MSQKSKDPSSATRIRDNQRRSRSRRAAHLQSLQQRVQEFERQGVAATLEMQQAARKVSRDNVRLRALLAMRGVGAEEVEAWLRAGEDGDGDVGMDVVSRERCATGVQHRGIGVEGSGLEGGAEGGYQVQSRHGCGRSSTDVQSRRTPEPQSNDIAAPVPHNAPPQPSSPPTTSTDPSPEDCPTTLTCFCPPPPAPSTTTITTTSTSSGLNISCEAAAVIIAQMRGGDGNADDEAIRAALGCRGRETCTVKNSTVLQIMDGG
ncbi:hypothetical protein BU24DRAFT_455508 [Aaosphaeria arxii CBS 175.79]|uniref:BZIP domain-containing protein n=1 Tax=Aaosphaeria arxii CBS 175.79 TaxID=1450172 RepID=A0A6A5X9I0_9PLEO|nr:uncharacterized protein BU24DRAFT_455508 [Aaosphaeria arxii CBS 175.79]KAF2009546.1 hypothetical protein BU24DRAFT_455508 [Aaosphaeria arxii CBS 175.79]